MSEFKYGDECWAVVRFDMCRTYIGGGAEDPKKLIVLRVKVVQEYTTAFGVREEHDLESRWVDKRDVFATRAEAEGRIRTTYNERVLRAIEKSNE